MITVFHILVYIFSLFIALVLFDFVRMAFMRWRWNKQMAKRVNDMAWRHWIGLVESRLGEFTTPPSMVREGEWFHDLWLKDFTPNAAAEKWLAQRAGHEMPSL